MRRRILSPVVRKGFGLARFIRARKRSDRLCQVLAAHHAVERARPRRVARGRNERGQVAEHAAGDAGNLQRQRLLYRRPDQLRQLRRLRAPRRTRDGRSISRRRRRSGRRSAACGPGGAAVARARKSMPASEGRTPVAAKRDLRPPAPRPARRGRRRRARAPSPRKSRGSPPAPAPARRLARSGGCFDKSFAATAGSSGAAAGISRSSGSTAPPGKTNLPGMKLCPAWRRPISTRNEPAPRSTTMSVAASRIFSPVT